MFLGVNPENASWINRSDVRLRGLVSATAAAAAAASTTTAVECIIITRKCILCTGERWATGGAAAGEKTDHVVVVRARNVYTPNGSHGSERARDGRTAAACHRRRSPGHTCVHNVIRVSVYGTRVPWTGRRRRRASVRPCNIFSTRIAFAAAAFFFLPKTHRCRPPLHTA